ncbi:hypothetical protein M8J76_007387 [Diaphorina citri]|nr:hypothetical protein M8J75_006097 [Diaphorina citri]KAI5719256.1 hypothetical protein M8J76_007387 [Diaphorina citri]
MSRFSVRGVPCARLNVRGPSCSQISPVDCPGQAFALWPALPAAMGHRTLHYQAKRYINEMMATGSASRDQSWLPPAPNTANGAERKKLRLPVAPQHFLPKPFRPPLRSPRISPAPALPRPVLLLFSF